MGAVREYQFVVGPETSTLPSAGAPTGADDTVTLSYADSHYLQGKAAVADITALKAIAAANRIDRDSIFVDAKQRLYHFDSAATGTGDDETIVTPSVGTGRWLSTNPYPNIEVALGHEQGSDPATPSANYRKLYPKTDGWYDLDANGVAQRIGSGGGLGEVNVIANPSASSNVTDWVASASGVTIARTTTANELPLSGVVNTGIKLTPVSGTDYVRYRWTMPVALKNRKLKVQWAQRYLSSYASGDFKVEVYQNAASNYGGAYTEFPLSTDASGTSSIPALIGTFTTNFDADSSDYYELRIVRTAGTSALVLSNVVDRKSVV